MILPPSHRQDISDTSWSRMDAEWRMPFGDVAQWRMPSIFQLPRGSRALIPPIVSTSLRVPGTSSLPAALYQSYLGSVFIYWISFALSPPKNLLTGARSSVMEAVKTSRAWRKFGEAGRRFTAHNGTFSLGRFLPDKGKIYLFSLPPPKMTKAKAKKMENWHILSQRR